MFNLEHIYKDLDKCPTEPDDFRVRTRPFWFKSLLSGFDLCFDLVDNALEHFRNNYVSLKWSDTFQGDGRHIASPVRSLDYPVGKETVGLLETTIRKHFPDWAGTDKVRLYMIECPVVD